MADPEDDEGPESPLEGATCAVHHDRMAFRVCPSCNKNACLGCWHPSIGRCHACLVRDAKTLPPVPWEDPTRSFPVRLLLTALGALSPDSSAPGFARESETNGLGFALLSFVPLALVAGIVPYTRTLLFGPLFEVQVIGGASREAIALDVAQASLTGFGVSVALVLALALPYVSLARAYADRGVPSAPVRLMAYRGWLIPLYLTLRTVLPFCLPAPTSLLVAQMPEVVAIVTIVLLLAAMRAVARMGSGAGPIATLAILFVPLSLMFLAERMLDPLAPTEAEIRGATPPTTTISAPR